MKSKRIALLWGGLVFAVALPLLPPSQESLPPPAPDKKSIAPVFSYDPEGRRDPFKDLFGGEQLKTKKVVSGLDDMDIEDLSLMGIVKSQNRYEAIVAFADGFPLTLRVGQKLADGYVLSIEAERVTFRKTSDKGIPFSKPQDIVKEITSEEPAHD